MGDQGQGSWVSSGSSSFCTLREGEFLSASCYANELMNIYEFCSLRLMRESEGCWGGDSPLFFPLPHLLHRHLFPWCFWVQGRTLSSWKPCVLIPGLQSPSGNGRLCSGQTRVPVSKLGQVVIKMS